MRNRGNVHCLHSWCLATIATLLCAFTSAALPISDEAFLKTCVKSFGLSPDRPAQDEEEQQVKILSENLDEALSVYFGAILNKRYYDNVLLLVLQAAPLPLVPRQIMLQPFVGVMMMKKEVAARYPLAERMAFLKLVLKTSDPVDRGAYHAVAMGKAKDLGALRDWIKTNGKLAEPLTQEAVRVLAEVDIAAFLKDVCGNSEPYLSDTAEAAEQQRVLSDKELQSIDRLEQLAGLARLIRLGTDKPDMDVDALWNQGALQASPIAAWDKENRKTHGGLMQYIPTKPQSRLGKTEIPAQSLARVFGCDAWYSLLGKTNVSLTSLMDLLPLITDESVSQCIATLILWLVFPDGTYRPNIPSESIQPLARLADTYVQQFKNNKTLLPACLVLYFPFLQKRHGFEAQYKSAWELYTQVVQSDSPGLRCHALVCLGWEEGRLPTPEGDMVRKAIDLEMQDAARDGDLCHVIAVTAAAENSGQTKSVMPIGPTVP